MKKGTLNASLIIFEGGVTLAEILSGSYFANLGFQKGFLAILLGRLIGAIVLFFAGMLGVKTKKPSMEIARTYFGDYGCFLFTGFNMIQLLGWAAFMSYDAAIAANTVLPIGHNVWVLLVTGVISILILVGLKDTEWLNRTAALSLFVLTIILSFVIFKNEPLTDIPGNATFASAVEVTVAMSLSWLPIVNDYTSEYVEDAKGMAAVALANLGIGIWMSLIGLGSVIYTGSSNLAQILVKVGLGAIALIILVLSTGTANYIDANSAGISFQSISKKVSPKIVGLIVLGIGMVLAMTVNLESMESFLELMSSLFSPAIALELTQCFILRTKPKSGKLNGRSMIIWFFGILLYQWVQGKTLYVGPSILSMIFVMVLTMIDARIFKNK